jgi:TPR repeat protein
MLLPASLRIGSLALALLASATVGFAQDAKPILLSRTGGAAWANAKELEASAKNGNPKACAQLGEALLRGDADFPQDVPRALVLLEQAARAGQASAAFRLGMLLDHGDHVAPDHARALAYFRAAAAGGAAEAFHNLGVAYSTAGHGVKRDYPEALAWLILARQHGTTTNADDALRAHLRSLRRPEWIAAGEKRAAELARELAQGNVGKFLPPPAPFDRPAPAVAEAGSSPPVATLAPPSLGPPIENPVGKLSLEPEAAPALPRPTMPKLPSFSGLADGPLPEAPVKLVLPTGRSMSWPGLTALEADAKAGDADALAALGKLYLTGQQVATDAPRAIPLLERGAKAGSADAAAQLAELYTQGVQAARDEKKAFTYTLQAARGGVRTAIYNLGAFYANGTGTTADYTESLAWLIVARHFNLDSGQLARIHDYLAKSDPRQIPLAEQRATARVKEIETARAQLGL